MLVATMNPCLCGYYGDSTKECSCNSTQIMAYQKRLSGPLLDRIDLILNVSKVSHIHLLTQKALNKKQHPKVFEHIIDEQEVQKVRYNSCNIYNASLTSSGVKKRLTLTPEATRLPTHAAKQLGLTARSYFKLIKVAQTIADLADGGAIESPHIAEALQYRSVPPA